MSTISWRTKKFKHCEIFQQIIDTAYKFHLVFNIKHLSPCFIDDDMKSSKSSFQSEEINVEGFKGDDDQLIDLTLIELDNLEKVD